MKYLEDSHFLVISSKYERKVDTIIAKKLEVIARAVDRLDEMRTEKLHTSVVSTKGERTDLALVTDHFKKNLRICRIVHNLL